MLDSLEQIKDLLHDIPDLDPMLAKEGSQHVQNCILVFRQYDSINEQRLRTGDAAQIILAIIEFSNKGNELIRGYKKSMNDFRTV